MHTTDQVTVTGTGYCGAFRQGVRQLTWQLGAQYSGDLTYGVTTHLVCKDSFPPDTEKVSVARAWGIPIVQHEWLLDSVQQGGFLPVDPYCLAPKSSAAARLLPASVTLRANRHKATSYNITPSSPLHTNSADVIDIEVLRDDSSPIACQLADLLLATPTSPTAGTWQNSPLCSQSHHLACKPMLFGAGCGQKSNHWSAEKIDPDDMAPGMPPPSPTSSPLSTPNFSNVAHSTSSTNEKWPASAVHRYPYHGSVIAL